MQPASLILNSKNMSSFFTEHKMLVVLIAVLLCCVLLHRVILRVLFGMVIVPENRLGLVTKKFVLFGAHKSLPDGKIIATRGEAGFRPEPLLPAFIGVCGYGNIVSICNPLQ